MAPAHEILRHDAGEHHRLEPQLSGLRHAIPFVHRKSANGRPVGIGVVVRANDFSGALRIVGNGATGVNVHDPYSGGVWLRGLERQCLAEAGKATVTNGKNANITFIPNSVERGMNPRS